MEHKCGTTIQQIWALARKTMLIAVVRHWFATLFRAVLLPIAFMVFLVNIKYLVYPNNGYGVGSPVPVASLLDAIPTSRKLVLVQPPNIGTDVSRVVDEVTRSLLEQKNVIFLTNETDLLSTCLESLAGSSDCFAAVVFNDSPMTVGKNGIWGYTIRADSSTEGNGFQVNQHDNDEEMIFLPLQVAIDNSIINSTAMPQEYMYTTISQAQDNGDKRKKYQQLIIKIYGIVFFIAFSSQIYHVVGMMTTERASGMAQLIDAMGGTPGIRIISYLISFNIIYATSWVIFGILLWNEVFSSSSVLISLFWQILTGMALTSASVFAAAFFTGPQIASICCTVGFLVVAQIGLIIDQGAPPTSVVTVLSLLFPSMNYMFMMGYMCRYEEQGLPTNLLRAPEPTSEQPSASHTPGIAIWALLVLHIFIYPILAAYAERAVNRTTYNKRIAGAQTGRDSAVEVTNLTKIYRPKFYQRWLTRTKAKDVVAVTDLALAARRGQITCLLGANGSGKTTTLEMIAGFRRPTRGFIHIDAGRGQLGICPQRNVLWDELTVRELVDIWNAIKRASQSVDSLNSILVSCDLMPKRNARADTLSGGQKRKLQLACMLIGSTVCLLDEVSSGLDLLSRRSIWNILLAERSRRTMVISTHILDEVDILADHVVIISRGCFKAEGSTVELKAQYAKGYKLFLDSESPDTEMVAPTRCRADTKVLDAADSSAAMRLLAALERKGHVDISIRGPTIQDVFLTLHDEPQGLQKDGTNEFVCDDSAPSQDAIALTAAVIPNTNLSSGSRPTFWLQARLLFLKRFTILRRNWWPYLIAIVIPLITTPLLKPILSYYKTPSCNSSVALNVHSIQPVNLKAATQMIGYTQIFAGPPSANDSIYNVISNFPIGAGIDLRKYSDQFIFAENLVDFEGLVSEKFSNIAPGAIYLGDNFSTPIYAFVGDARIFPAMVMQNLWSQVRGGLAISVSYAPFDSYIPPTAGSSISYIAFFALAQAVYPALFALYPTYERLHKVRALQYSNGVRDLPLWISYAMFDFIFVLVVSTICTGIVAVQAPTWFSVGYLFPVLSLYGLSATLFSYVASIISRSQLAAFAVSAGAQAIMVLLSLLAFTLVEFFATFSNLQSGVDAITFALDLVFPVGNVIRAVLIGLNVCAVSCRNGAHISYGGSFYAYGGPIFYLCLQIVFLFCLLRWLDRGHMPVRARRRNSEGDEERIAWSTRSEVEDEKTRAVTSESDPIRVLGVTKVFGSKMAVRNATFGVQKGEILVVLGPNGGGKSTLFDMIRGQMRPDHGKILLQGYDTATQRYLAERSLGACPQFDALDDTMTTSEHLKFYARMKGVAEFEQERNVQVILDKTGLRGYEQCLASKLSGGNQRKLSLAIALLGNPAVLVLDEPSSSMDAVSKMMMWKTLKHVAAGRSLLLTTHSMEEAEALATRAAIISTHLLSIGTTRFLRQLYGNFYHVHIILKSAPTSSVSEIEAVERWITEVFIGALLNPFGNYHGQVKFSVPASSGGPGSQERPQNLTEPTRFEDNDEIQVVSTAQLNTTGTARTMFAILEDNRDAIGIAHYSIAATTLEEVFINILRDNKYQEQC